MQPQAETHRVTLGALVFPISKWTCTLTPESGHHGEMSSDRPRMFYERTKSREEESSHG